MALFFARFAYSSPSTVYDALVAHYAKVPQPSLVPSLLPPVPHMVSWFRLDCSIPADIVGTSDNDPFTGPVLPLPAEVSGGLRNSIDLRGLILNVGNSTLTLSFQII